MHYYHNKVKLQYLILESKNHYLQIWTLKLKGTVTLHKNILTYYTTEHGEAAEGQGHKPAALTAQLRDMGKTTDTSFLVVEIQAATKLNILSQNLCCRQSKQHRTIDAMVGSANQKIESREFSLQLLQYVGHVEVFLKPP